MSDQTQIGDSTLAIPRSEAVGGRIGPFKILQLIGEGGFGSVFEAEQEHPVKRRVALKIIKLGMDTREVITRFEAERQALAMMDHPNIARVLDAGATDSGRPYFVMELVEGEPISGYCNRHKLPIDARLRLFEQVCAAVQHAHTKGIIHRDLKPNNVLVSTQDGQPFAKVIDFGIAKATSGRLTDKTMFTEANLMMGTPLYMSPEQAEGSADIDTRTDIYSLGVILYELLTGSTPIDSYSLRAAGYAEVQRIIREVEPLRPSARLSHATTAKAHVAQLRQTEPRKLSGAVRGELDWIVMKAIEKDRTRRYETANAFAMDVRRYLSGEPVLAVPPGAGYRFGKFVRRHRGPVVAGALIAAALLAGIAGFAWQARIARARVVELAQVAEFEAAMLGQVDPAQTGKLLSGNLRSMYAAALVKAGVPEAERNGKAAAFADALQQVNTTDAARDLIDSTVLKPAIVAIDQRFRGEPLVDAYLRQTLADRYVGLGLYDAAAPLQRSALATRRRLLGEDNQDTVTSIINVGVLLRNEDRYSEAEPFLREAVQKTRQSQGGDRTLAVFSLFNLGLLLEAEGKLDAAGTFDREALDSARREFGENNQTTLLATIVTGGLFASQGRYADAVNLLAPEEAVVRKAFTGANAYWPATLLMHLGEAHTGLGNHAVAEAELLEARSILLVSPNARARDLTREYTRAFVALYVQWNRAEPGKGYNTKAAAWKQRLAALGASTPAPAAPH
jgi:tRNA A-37 threonylcarbamoyl transferase component Bud32/tetratricopeptide (TPR) repeat protein